MATAPWLSRMTASIAGCDVQVIPASLHAQFRTTWTAPPASLAALESSAVVSPMRARSTCRPRTPSIRVRRKARFGVSASTHSWVLAPKFSVGSLSRTATSASTMPASVTGGQVQSTRQAPGQRASAAPSQCSALRLSAPSPQTPTGIVVDVVAVVDVVEVVDVVATVDVVAIVEVVAIVDVVVTVEEVAIVEVVVMVELVGGDVVVDDDDDVDDDDVDVEELEVLVVVVELVVDDDVVVLTAASTSSSRGPEGPASRAS